MPLSAGQQTSLPGYQGVRPNPSLLSGLPQHSVLSPAFASCKANNSIPPNILFSNHHYIRIVDLHGDSEIFAKNQSNAVAIYYYRFVCPGLLQPGQQSLPQQRRLSRALPAERQQRDGGLGVGLPRRISYWPRTGSPVSPTAATVTNCEDRTTARASFPVTTRSVSARGGNVTASWTAMTGATRRQRCAASFPATTTSVCPGPRSETSMVVGLCPQSH